MSTCQIKSVYQVEFCEEFSFETAPDRYGLLGNIYDAIRFIDAGDGIYPYKIAFVDFGEVLCRKELHQAIERYSIDVHFVACMYVGIVSLGIDVKNIFRLEGHIPPLTHDKEHGRKGKRTNMVWFFCLGFSFHFTGTWLINSG